MKISFEFFPPNTEAGYTSLKKVHEQLSGFKPEYFSITYGAGGSTRERTLKGVNLLLEGEVPVAPHISCIGDSKDTIRELLDHYQDQGIHRLVALRGDLPSGQVGFGELPYALDLVKFIREHSGSHFHIEVAAYPEMHPQARSFNQDIGNLIHKYEAGADAAITQFFYNVDAYLYLREKLSSAGIHKPLVPGIMPIINSANLLRFASGCGAEVPRFIQKRLADLGEDKTAVVEFGTEVVSRMCERLAREGVPALHFYTMNKTEPTASILQNVL